MRLIAASFVVLLVLITLHLSHSLTVHLVCHTHDDVGWLKTVDQYYMGANNSIQHAGVQYILDSVVLALQENDARRFIYVEQAFFQRWWRQQTSAMQTVVRGLVARGQLEFINGGWSMHDEGATHYVDMIDQTTLGHKFINDEFGVQPTIGWQIDPFGHSATQAALLSAEVGFDGLFFGRIDYADRDARIRTNRTEFIWRASESLGPAAQVFTGVFQTNNVYGPPDGLCFDLFCGDNPVQDDPRLEDYNVKSRVDDFVKAALAQAAHTVGDDIMWTLGSDFMYENANLWYKNLDKLIRYVNADGRVRVQYSTPSIYVKAKYATPKLNLTVKTDDFFPFGFAPQAMMVGYYSSRPALKRFIRQGSALLQVARQFEVLTRGDGSGSQTLWEAQGVTQHHDSITGTSKQHVAYDYARRVANGISVAEDTIHVALNKIICSECPPIIFDSCPLNNISICNVTQSAQHVLLIIYNALAVPRNELIQLPINNNAASVYNENNTLVASGIMINMNNNARKVNSAPHTLQFMADLAPLSITTYFIKYDNTSNSDNKLQQTIQPYQPRRELQSLLPDISHFKNSAADAPSLSSFSNDLLQVSWYSINGSLASVTDLTANRTYSFTQTFAYYPALVMGEHDNRNDGAYDFATSATAAISVSNVTWWITFTNNITLELHQTITDWLVQIIRLPVHSNGIPAIEFEWTVGPVPITGDSGKDIIVRYNAVDIQNNGIWFTDSNGREFQRRQRNVHPTWPFDISTPIPSNYYPCNAVTYITDNDRAMAVVADRSQGASSLNDSALELMIHRRILHDDGFGVNEPLNETDAITGADGTRIGNGLIITGKHIVILSAADSINRYLRAVQTRVYRPPHLSVSSMTSDDFKAYTETHLNSRSFIQSSLPANVELMTLQSWNNGTILLRLAHSFGITEDPVYSKPAAVDLATLFTTAIASVNEVSLTANQQITQRRKNQLKWSTNSDTYAAPISHVEDTDKIDSDLKAFVITLTALQIRSFVVTLQS